MRRGERRGPKDRRGAGDHVRSCMAPGPDVGQAVGQDGCLEACREAGDRLGGSGEVQGTAPDQGSPCSAEPLDEPRERLGRGQVARLHGSRERRGIGGGSERSVGQERLAVRQVEMHRSRRPDSRRHRTAYHVPQVGEL